MNTNRCGVALLGMIFLAGGHFVATAFSAQATKPADTRPIAGHDTVFIEEMTWMEVRDAIEDGKITIIIATGGVEENGPYLVTGKHNFILRATTNAIVRKLGNALVAPIVPFVLEGRIDPPGGHMKFPGTVSVSEETYQRLLTDIVASFRAHGFRDIVLIGDSGGNQKRAEVGCSRTQQKVDRGKDSRSFRRQVLRPRVGGQVARE